MEGTVYVVTLVVDGASGVIRIVDCAIGAIGVTDRGYDDWRYPWRP